MSAGHPEPCAQPLRNHRPVKRRAETEGTAASRKVNRLLRSRPVANMSRGLTWSDSTPQASLLPAYARFWPLSTMPASSLRSPLARRAGRTKVTLLRL